MKWLEKHNLVISHLLCVIVIFTTAWPVLEHPRLEADDYRYLHHIKQWSIGHMDVTEAMTVENRWDHLWFMQEEGRIRFFRPTVILSYALDWKFWSNAFPPGPVLSNVLIHLACSLLVGFLLHRLLGAGIPALFSTALFAGLASHAECIWYVAGRTDSLAALGFLGAFALHVSDRRWWALPCFAFGFFTKEMVVVAPVIFAAYDFWLKRRRPDWRLLAAYGLISLAVWAMKQLALGGEGSDFVYPYLISPMKPGFVEHLWLQFRSYTGNLIAAEVTIPFAHAATVAQIHWPVVSVIAIMVAVAVGWVLRRDRRCWLLLLMGGLVWLPTSFVYLSERFLYLPSVAFAGILGLFASSGARRRQTALCVLLGMFALFHVVKLHAKHAVIADQPGSVEEMLQQLEPVRGKIEKGDHLLLVNLPGLFVRAQFAQEILRVALDDPALKVDVLTMMPGQNGTAWQPGNAYPMMGAGVSIQEIDAHRLLLQGRAFDEDQPPHTIQEPGLKSFNWVALDAGRYKTPGLGVKIVNGSTAGATAIEFECLGEKPMKLLVWRADCSNLNEHPWIRRKKARVELVHF